ncbi:MAG TPA: surface-adhesin E family protein [Thermodesulfobacteriota bacterium]
MRKRLIILTVSIFAVSVFFTGAWAEDWIFVTSTGNGKYGSYVDMDSISEKGNLRYFDMYHHLKGSKSYKDFPIERLYSKSYVNCDARTIGYIEVTYEWVNRMEKITMNIPGSSEVASSMPVKPNSVDEAILDFVCNYKKEDSN